MANLPEPNFIERDPDKITQEWINLYQQKSDKVLQPAQIEQLMIDIGAYRESLLRIKIQETAKQNLLSYAPKDILEHIGDPLGVKGILSKRAFTLFEFSVDEALDFDFVLPIGIEIEAKDGLVIFQTLKSGVLKSGEMSIQIEGACTTFGAVGNNYSAGAISNLLTPLNYITDVQNITVSSGGADEEDEEKLRERIRQAPEKFSNAGSRGAYLYHTLSAHQDIVDVAIISPNPGVVNIYPLTRDGNPSDEVIEIVQKHLSDEKVRPLTDNVFVLSPEKIDFSVQAKIILYQDSDLETVQKTIDVKLGEYKLQLREKLGKNVVQTQIITILNSIHGVYKVELMSPVDTEIEKNQWANLETFEILIEGYADE